MGGERLASIIGDRLDWWEVDSQNWWGFGHQKQVETPAARPSSVFLGLQPCQA